MKFSSMTLKLAGPLFTCLIMNACAEKDEQQLPDRSPCSKAFAHNREVSPKPSEIPYMETCGLDVKTAKFQRDGYYGDITVSQEYVNSLYDELKITDELLQKNNIPYSIIWGTLLGQIRNGGLIPNDDDIDIAVHEKFANDIKNLSEQLKSHGYRLDDFFFGFKVFKEGAGTGGLDIFLMDKRNVKGSDVLALSRDQAFDHWPENTLALTDLDKLIRVKFGPLEVSSMKLQPAKEYLTRVYGNDWYTVTIKSWDHIHSRPGSNVKIKLMYDEYYHLVPRD